SSSSVRVSRKDVRDSWPSISKVPTERVNRRTAYCGGNETGRHSDLIERWSDRSDAKGETMRFRQGVSLRCGLVQIIDYRVVNIKYICNIYDLKVISYHLET